MIREAGEAVGFGNFLEENWDELVVGAASVAGFAVGGPIGAIAVGAVVNGATAAMQDQNPWLGAAYGAAGGIFGAWGWGVKGAAFAARSAQLASGLTGRAAEKAAIEKGLLGALPTRLGGAHLAPWRTYAGLVGPLTTGWGADEVRDMIGSHVGFPAIPLIDISADELDEIPDDMPHVYMPDPARLPEGLAFTAPMQRNFRTLPGVELDCWKSFGEKPVDTTEPLPSEEEVSDIFGEKAAGIPEYAQRVQTLRDRYIAIRSRSDIVARAAERSAELCSGGREDLAASISAQKMYVSADPRDRDKLTELQAEYSEKLSNHSGIPVFLVDPGQLATAVQSEDSYTLAILESSYASTEMIMAYYADQFQAAAAALDEYETPQDTDSGSADRERADDSGSGWSGNLSGSGWAQDRGEGGGDPIGDRSGAADESGVAAPAPLDLGTDAGSEREADTRRGAEAAAAGSAGETALGGASTEAPAGQTLPVTTNPGGMGSPFETMALTQLMQSALNRRTTGADAEKDSHGDDNAHPAATPSGLRPGAVSAPGPGAPPSGLPAGQPNGQTGPVRTAPPTVDDSPPVVKPVGAGPSGNVVYTFPDGRTQEVSAVVARALDAAFGNAAGTDARAAYADTPAGWTDEKKIGARTDPYRLMTGDIGVWAERTAVLVVFEAPDSPDATIEVVADGALKPVESLAEMRDGDGEFGSFTGFFHPPGIEKAASEPAAPVGRPAGIDQPAASVAVPG